jgi:hypothetical protein
MGLLAVKQLATEMAKAYTKTCHWLVTYLTICSSSMTTRTKPHSSVTAP